MAKHDFPVATPHRGRLARALTTVAAALTLTVAGVGAGSASADPYWDPCEDPSQMDMPCTTH